MVLQALRHDLYYVMLSEIQYKHLKTSPPSQNYFIHLGQKPLPSTVPSFPCPSKCLQYYKQCCESFSIQAFPRLPPTPPFYFSKYMHTFDPGRGVATERGNNAGLSGWQKDRVRKRGTGRWCVGARSIFTARLDVSRFGASYTLLPAMWVYLATSHSVHHFGFGKDKISEIMCSINENKLVHLDPWILGWLEVLQHIFEEQHPESIILLFKCECKMVGWTHIPGTSWKSE